MKNKFRNTGLPSLNESAVDRRRQLVTGRARVGGGIPPRLFLSGLAVLVVGGFLYYRSAQSELAEQREGILTKQRATSQLLSPKLLPLRDRVEESALALSSGGTELIAEGVAWDKVFSAPSLYLRLLHSDASSTEAIRKAAATSMRDGFTSCLLRDMRATLPKNGIQCQESTECQVGEFCNEYSHCSRPSSPFNVRLLYRGLSVLSDEWVAELEGAGNDYKLKAYERTLDSVTQVDIPIAIEVHQAAKYTFIVIDEEPKDGLPSEIPGAFETDAERVQRVEHRAKVGIWDLTTGALLARIHADAAGELRSAGTTVPGNSAEAQAARARLANSCGLALAVKSRLLPSTKLTDEQ